MFNKLKGKILEQRLTYEQVADAIGINKVTLWRKLNGRSDWTRHEMEDICTVLGIDSDDINLYFFR